jgi:hypothetical protein
MVLSMAVVGAVVAAIFLVVVVQRPEVQGPIRPEVDVDQVLSDVRLGAPFSVLEPATPDGWTPNSAWFEAAGTGAVASDVGGSVLHVGYLTPDGSYVQVRQTDADRAVAVAEWVESSAGGGSVTLGDRSWQELQDAAGETVGLVTTNGDATVVVSGKADPAELEELAAALT